MPTWLQVSLTVTGLLLIAGAAWMLAPATGVAVLGTGALAAGLLGPDRAPRRPGRAGR